MSSIMGGGFIRKDFLGAWLMTHGRLLLHMAPSTMLHGNFVDFVQFNLIFGKLWSHRIG